MSHTQCKKIELCKPKLEVAMHDIMSSWSCPNENYDAKSESSINR